jgi:hypothetical protein
MHASSTNLVMVASPGRRPRGRPAFHAAGNVATAGGCLGPHYLATWVLSRTVGRELAAEILGYVAPVGQTTEWCDRAFAAITAIAPYL